GGPLGFLRASPVTGSYAARPCHFSRLASANANPLPFSVSTWITRGPLSERTCPSVWQSLSTSWPSIGPKYRKPSSSNSIPSLKRFLNDPSTLRAVFPTPSPNISPTLCVDLLTPHRHPSERYY